VKLLAQAVREMVDPREIVESMQTVAAGKPLNGIKPKVSDMLDANNMPKDGFTKNSANARKPSQQAL
jgi:hypothetical protein